MTTNKKPVIQFVLFSVIVGQQLIASFTHVIAKDITDDMSPEIILFYRALFVCLAFLIWMGFNRRRIKKIEKKDIITLIILGALNIPINQYLFFTAVHLTGAPNVALAYALSPVFVLIIAIIFLKERAGIQKVIGVILALLGIFLVFSEQGFDFSSDAFLGNILILTASLSWALYTVIGKNFSRKYGAFYATALSMFMGFALYIPIFIFSSARIDIGKVDSVQWLQLLYMAIITSGLGYGLWYWALERTEASRLAVFNNMQPVFTTILSIIFFAQDITMFFIAGGVIIISGVILTQRG